MKRIYLVCMAVLCSILVYAQPKKREMRAAWIATVANIDWPQKGCYDAIEQQKQLLTILDTLVANNMNAVVFQIRPTADALYNSSLEPWSHWLTGIQGQTPQPYYDPLQFMIEEAHARCIEVHIWLNPYRVTNKMAIDMLSKEHIFHEARHLFVKYGDQWYFDPGLDETRQFLNRVVADIVQRYDVDAIHFDDYFYPYKVAGKDFPDAASFKKYPRGYTAAQKADWRRNNVDMVIAELQRTIKGIKPWVEFGISPFGVWRNQSSDPRGSATQAGVQNYDDLYADILKWLREGTIDYVTPQLYWEIGKKVADYDVLAKWWSENSYGKNLYVGLYASQLTNPKATAPWKQPNELARQMRLNMRHPEIDGCMLYSMQAVMRNPYGLCDSLKNDFYRYPALTPINRNIKSEEQVPACPQNVRLLTDDQGARLLMWDMEKEVDGCAVAYYVVYAFAGDTIGNFSHPANIVCRTAACGVDLVHFDRFKQGNFTLAVTAVNKYKRESCLSDTVLFNVGH